jgi:hypothetical protein
MDYQNQAQYDSHRLYQEYQLIQQYQTQDRKSESATRGDEKAKDTHMAHHTPNQLSLLKSVGSINDEIPQNSMHNLNSFS